jgi:acyl-CoA synthetase (NDP forming)/GNAT superfamily N-acetyltransferase
MSPTDAPVAPADVLLSDGSIATICALGPEHLDGVRLLHEGTSEENLRFRFCSAGAVSAAARYVEHLRALDGTLALVVLRHDRVVGVGTAEPVAPGTAEVAFLVDDAHHGLGVGSLLLEHLAAAARRRGITRFTAEVLADNHTMLTVLRDAGFAERQTAAYGSVEVVLDTAVSPAALAAADHREDQAESRSLQPLLRPRSVAVVGVRRDGTGIGAAVVSSIQGGGFTGTVHVVHPQAAEVCGLATCASLAGLGQAVDLVVVAVPADQVLDVLTDVAAAGTRAVVVLTSGFEELGGDGRTQAEMLALARTHDMRLVGPNCLGVVDNGPGIRLNATFSRRVPPSGGLAVASQSGGLGILLHDLARHLGLGLAFSVSLGNKIDVSGNDLLAAWIDDAEVTAAALYLESFGNPLKFARLARRFSHRKPLLAVLGGRSAGGRRAGASHTAAAATVAVGADALFSQAGVICCEGPEDLAATALVVDRAPLPAGRRVAILSNAGGLGVVAADQAERHGLEVPVLGDPLREQVGRYVAGTSGTSNPVDVGAGARPEELVEVARLLASSGEVDAILVALAVTGITDPGPVWTGLVAHAESERGVTLVVAIPDDDRPGPEVCARLAVLPSTEAAVRSLAHAADYAAWRADAEAEQAGAARPDGAEAAGGITRAATERLLGELGESGGWLDLGQIRRLLAETGLAPVGAAASDAEEAARRADEMGFPVAVKVVDPAVQHLTERGLVRVGLRSAAEVRAAVTSFGELLGRVPRDVLVQPVVSGVELALGVVGDPSLGPLVMVAAGGIATDLLDDRSFLLPPVTRRDALRALTALRVWPLLDGYRGAAPLAVEAVVDAVVRLARLAVDVPQVVELDVNPLVVTESACLAVDVTVRLAPGEAPDAGVPRRLRGRQG